MKKVLIVGATSAIAEAVARRYASQGARLCLAGRNLARLEAIAADLRTRGAADVTVAPFTAEDPATHGTLVDVASDALGTIDVVLVAHGVLPDQAASERDPHVARHSIDVNAVSVVSVLTVLANRLEAQGSGRIAVISSVAGDRGRQSNYVYGSAKALLDVFCAGLRHRLHRKGIPVTVIKPGFVDTPMTAHLPKGGPLWATPDKVAARIVAAVDRGASTVYAPGFWWLIMAIVRNLPESVFHKSKL